MKRVLIAEDNIADQELMRLSFAAVDPDFEITCVTDGEELFERLDEINPFDLCFVMLDLNMPRMSGIDVLTRLTSEERFRTVPVIVFSSSAQPTDVKQCYSSGANAYVRKPSNFAGYQQTITAITEFWGETNVLARPYAA